MSKSTRRAFLTTAGTFLAVAVAAPGQAVRPLAGEGPAPGPAHSPGQISAWVNNQPQYQTVSLYQFTAQSFQPLVGTTFQVKDSAGRQVSLRLMAVNDLTKQNPGSRTAFSLRFQQKSGTMLDQGTYQFTTPPLGTFLLFVVPAKKSGGASYTAIINRL